MGRETYRNIITSDDLTSKINPKNSKLIQQFLKEKNTRSSDTTIESYSSDLNIFFTWVLLHCDNKFFVDIKKLEFSEFFSFCVEDLRWGSARFSRMRSVLSSLSNFIEKYFDDEFPAFKSVILKSIENMPKNPAREKTILSEEQINSLFEYLKSNSMIQEACWLALAIASGSRFSELLRFTTDCIDPDNVVFDGLFIETTKKIKSNGRTKTGKMLTKYIIKDMFMPYYEKWLPERKRIMTENDQDHDYLFIKKDGSPAEDHIVRNWIAKFDDFLKVPFYAHALRHYTTTFLSKLGLPHQLIRELFSWESIEMVEVYNDLEAKDRVWSELENLKKHLENNG